MDPATWIYLALLAASTAASAQAQHKTNKARAHVQAEDTRRRKEQEAAAEASAQKTQAAYFDTKDKAAQRDQELAQLYAAKEGPAPTTDAAGTHLLDTAAPTSSTQTIEGAQREMAKGRARASQRATSQAQLGTFGDVFAESGREAGRNAQDIGLAASKMQGWTQNVLPSLYAKANIAGRDWATTADLLKVASAVYGAGALSAPSSAANSTAGTLDQMSGVPAEFAGKDLFGMGAKFGGGIPFSSAAAIGEVIPTAGRYDNGIGSQALLNLGHNPFAQNPMQEAILRKQMMGIALTDRERAILAQHF